MKKHRTLLRGALLSPAFALLATLAFAQTFTRTSYPDTGAPVDMFVADVNHDGLDDVVTVNNQSSLVSVFINQGNGTFSPSGPATFPTASRPVAVVVVDLNNDGFPDIATVSCDTSVTPAKGTLSVLLNPNNGLFSGHQDTPLPGCPNSLGFLKSIVTPFNNLVIGMGSVVLGGDGPHGFLYMRNDGTGNFPTFDQINAPAGALFLGVSAGDYNHDGIPDVAGILRSSGQPDKVSLYFSTRTSAGWAGPQTIATINATAFRTATVDLNGDGVGDVLTTFDGSTSRGVLAAINNGNATAFTYRTLGLSSTWAVQFRAASGDFNGDGKQDIIVPVTRDPATGADAIALFPATSTTTWGAPKFFTTAPGDESRVVSPGNFSADGKLDFATVGQAGNDLTVFLNTTAPAATCQPPAAAGVHICSPGTSTTSPVKIVAAANGGTARITAMKAYIDGKLVATSSSGSLSASVATAAGTHRLNVNAWNSAGKVFTTQLTFTVH